MKFFITKYALSGKLLELDGKKDEDGGYAHFREYPFVSFKIGRDAFERLEDALADIEARRNKKIRSLEKQIAQLKKLSFGRPQ